MVLEKRGVYYGTRAVKDDGYARDTEVSGRHTVRDGDITMKTIAAYVKSLPQLYRRRPFCRLKYFGETTSNVSPSKPDSRETGFLSGGLERPCRGLFTTVFSETGYETGDGFIRRLNLEVE